MCVPVVRVPFTLNSALYSAISLVSEQVAQRIHRIVPIAAPWPPISAVVHLVGTVAMMSSAGTSGRTAIAARHLPVATGKAGGAFARRRPSRQVAQWQKLCASLKETALVPVMERGELTKFPGEPGVYAVFDAACDLQYIGLSRKVRGLPDDHWARHTMFMSQLEPVALVARDGM